MRRRHLLALAAAALAAAAAAGAAFACSCELRSAREKVETASVAFVGEVVDVEHETHGPYRYRIRVDAVAKGRVPELLELESGFTSCQIELRAGGRYGFLLQPDMEVITCNVVSEHELRDAASALPTPDGRGPVALLVGGAFGPARTVALDARGRVLGYGLGEGEAQWLASCPGSRRALELVWPGWPGPFRLVVRDVATLAVVREDELRLRAGQRFVAGLHCADARGRRAFVLAVSEGGHDRLLQIESGDVAPIWSGQTVGASFARGSAWLATRSRGGWAATEIDLADGTVREHGALPGPVTALQPSPDGSHLAGVVSRVPFSFAEPAATLVVLPLREPGRARSVRLAQPDLAAHAVWLDSRRIAVLPAVRTHTLLAVHDAETLEEIDGESGWFAPFVAQPPVALAAASQPRTLAGVGAGGAILLFDGTKIATGTALPGTHGAIAALARPVALAPGAGAAPSGDGLYPPEPVDAAAQPPAPPEAAQPPEAAPAAPSVAPSIVPAAPADAAAARSDVAAARVDDGAGGVPTWASVVIGLAGAAVAAVAMLAVRRRGSTRRPS